MATKKRPNKAESSKATSHLGKMGERPKSFVVSIVFKDAWPGRYTMVWNYTTLDEAMNHLGWAAAMVAVQQGKDAIRKYVILSFKVDVFLRSKVRDGKYTPIEKFISEGQKPPSGVRLGYLELLT